LPHRPLRPRLAVALLAATGLAACAAPPAEPVARAPLAREPAPRQPAFREEANAGERGTASYYGRGFHGRRTASGERFDRNAPTAAHRTLPLGTVARVTNLDTGESETVTINDRGPFTRGRLIDVSEGVADRLGMRREGTAPVEVTPLSIPGS
jgi:rare lipoprotein A